MKTLGYSGFLPLGALGTALLFGPSPQAGGGGRAATEADYIGLNRDAEPLRGSFNADQGKVRILMLVAPT